MFAKRHSGGSNVAQRGRIDTEIHLLRSIKCTYSEIVPVLSGQGDRASITLLGRRRDDPQQLDQIVSRLWTQGEPVKIVWEDSETVRAK